MVRFVFYQNRHIALLAAVVIAVFYALVLVTPLEAASVVKIIRPATFAIIVVGTTQWLRSRMENHNDRFLITLPTSRRQIITANFLVTFVLLSLVCLALAVDGVASSFGFAAGMMIGAGVLQLTVLRFGNYASTVIIAAILVILGIGALLKSQLPDMGEYAGMLRDNPVILLVIGLVVYGVCWAWAIRIYEKMDV